MSDTATFERDFFRALNACLEPAVRAGLLSPTPFTPLGLIVLETTGRKSGLPRRAPLLAARVGEALVVSTFRGERSEWVRNIRARPSVRYHLLGREYEGIARLVGNGNDDEGDPLARALAPLVAPGWAVAIITPAPAAP